MEGRDVIKKDIDPALSAMVSKETLIKLMLQRCLQSTVNELSSDVSQDGPFHNYVIQTFM